MEEENGWREETSLYYNGSYRKRPIQRKPIIVHKVTFFNNNLRNISFTLHTNKHRPL